jgi:holo-[acyl-carrier protein] synthase
MAGFRVGCDLTNPLDVAASIEQFGDRYLRRIYTDAELAGCAGPILSQRLAARFAAKEAVAKVLGELSGALPWRSIEVGSDHSGRPVIALHAQAAALAAAQGIRSFEVSLSHEPIMAMAVVLAEVDAQGAQADEVKRR